MESPCLECLVRASCCELCSPWFNWVARLFPIDIEIPFIDFIQKANTVGPLDNFWIANYKNVESFRLMFLNGQYEMTITTRNWKE
jgi:hypothetical protein